jgi:hypothetical protein
MKPPFKIFIDDCRFQTEEKMSRSYSLSRANINPFPHSLDFALFESPLKNVSDLFLIETGLFH